MIDTATNTVVATIPLASGSGPMGLAITPDGESVYVANNGNDTASVIDTGTNTVVKTISVGSLPEDVAITPDGEFAYMTNNGSTTVSVIDTETKIVVKTFESGWFGLHTGWRLRLRLQSQ